MQHHQIEGTAADAQEARQAAQGDADQGADALAVCGPGPDPFFIHRVQQRSQHQEQQQDRLGRAKQPLISRGGFQGFEGEVSDQPAQCRVPFKGVIGPNVHEELENKALILTPDLASQGWEMVLKPYECKIFTFSI